VNRTSFDEQSSRAVLFSILAEARGASVPSSALTERLSSSRQAVFKLVNSLREEGVRIESEPQKGYRLPDFSGCDVFSPTLMEYLLRDNKIFHNCLYFKEVGSTQTVIKKLAQQDAPQGVVAVTDSQTEGRGRRGRVWQTPPGRNVTFSVLLRPHLKPGEVQLLNLAAGIAIRRAVDTGYNLRTELKWPNDVLVNNKKLCGILSEAAGEPDRIYYAVTGVGLNANLEAADFSSDIRDTATSLLLETGVKAARPALLAAVLGEFAELVAALDGPGGAAELIGIYRRECDTLGRDVRVVQDDEEFTGRATDVTDQGALVVSVNGRNRIFAAADVHHLRLS